MTRSLRTLSAVAAALIVGASVVTAQLPNASAAAFGMGGNFTAMARGYEAVAWNPANLAMPGRPLISVGLGIFGGSAGMDPIDVASLAEFGGKLVDSATKVAWIDKVAIAGAQRTRIDGGVTPIALSVGPIGVQFGNAFYTNLDLSPDAWEAWLFGNAGRSGGQPKALDFTGTSVRVADVSTGALSFALPIPINLTNGVLPDERAAIGISAKAVVGHGLVLAQDIGSTFGVNDTLLLRFPVITVRGNEGTSGESYNGIAGTGLGADLSVAWSGGPWKVGLLAENVFNSFKWDTTKLAYLPGTGTFVESSPSTDFDEQDYAAAPQALRDLVAAQAFKQAITVGAAFKLTPGLTLTADMKKSMGGDEAIVFGPKSRYGLGAEWRIVPFIPLRAGLASVTDGWQAGAGFGLSFLGYELGVATSIRRRGQASESGLMIGLVGIGR